MQVSVLPQFSASLFLTFTRRAAESNLKLTNEDLIDIDNSVVTSLKNTINVAAAVSPLALLLSSNAGRYPGTRMDLVLVSRLHMFMAEFANIGSLVHTFPR